MNARIIVLVTLALLGAVAVQGPLAEVLPFDGLPSVAADHGNTCEGWPKPIHDLLEECPHGPTP